MIRLLGHSLAIILALILSLSMRYITGGEATSFIFIFLFLSLYLWDDQFELKLYFVILCFFCVFFYFYWQYFGTTSYLLGAMSDDWHYDITWTQGYSDIYGLSPSHIRDYLNEISPGLGIMHNSIGYVYLVTIFQWLGNTIDEYHTLIPRIFNVYILVLISYISSKIYYQLFKDIKGKKIVIFIICFFPLLSFNSFHVFRDNIVLLLIVISFYSGLMVPKGNVFSRVKNYIILLLCCIVMYYYRVGNIPLIILSFFIPNFLNNYNLKVKKIFILLICLSFGFLIFIYLNQGFILSLGRSVAQYNLLNSEKDNTFVSAIFKAPLIISILPRLTYVFITPIPAIFPFYQAYLGLGTLLQLFLFPYLISALKDKKIALSIKITFLIYLLAVALTTMSVRHVSMFLPFMLILMVYSVRNYKLSLRNYISYQFYFIFMLFTFLIVSFIY